MSPLDNLGDLPDISAAEPAGPNLEFDADFIELERLIQGKVEQQYGSLVVAAEEPDWKGAVEKATELQARTYDLRVMAQLAVARLHAQGLSAYASTLAMICTLLETRWASVHPQLDPDDDNDPTLRANSLLGVAEPGRVMQYIRTLPLARSNRAGSVCWRDIAISSGAIEGDADTEKVPEATIAAAFRETDRAALATLRETFAAIQRDVTAIPAVFERETGYGTGPDFAEYGKLLKELTRWIDKYTPAAPEPEPEPEAALPAGNDGGGAPVAPVAASRASFASVTSLKSVASRADAMHLLDLVVQYYEEHEPSSPLPLLIGRARRLADKTFIDLLRDLAPDGVSQAETIVGRPNE